MSVRLLLCLVFITKIVAKDSTASQYESTSEYIIYNQRNTRKLVTESSNDSLVGTAQNINNTENKTNGTGNNINVISINEDINGTSTKKPDGNKEGMETQSTQIVNSFPPYSSYEVTENVIDIPDDRIPAGPIVPNYTEQPTLNLAKPINKTDTVDKIKEDNINTKKNRLSILHINAEFEDKVHEVQENKITGLLKGIKAYVNSFRKGIVNSVHSFFHKHQDVHEHGGKF